MLPSSLSCVSPYAAAQVEVLSAALRASSLDPPEEPMTSVGKGTESQTELTIDDQHNFKPIVGDIVPLIGDTVEVRSEFCTLLGFFHIRISRAPVMELYFAFMLQRTTTSDLLSPAAYAVFSDGVLINVFEESRS